MDRNLLCCPNFTDGPECRRSRANSACERQGIGFSKGTCSVWSKVDPLLCEQTFFPGVSSQSMGITQLSLWHLTTGPPGEHDLSTRRVCANGEWVGSIHSLISTFPMAACSPPYNITA